VAAKHQRPDREQERLDPQDQCVHGPSGVDCVEHERAEGADLRVLPRVVIARAGNGHAAPALRQVAELARVERLHEDGDRAGPGDLLDVDELVRRPDLAAGTTIALRLSRAFL
jgi:hypothetical protein